MQSNPLILPPGYRSKLDLLQTEVAIKLIKDVFEQKLAAALNLVRVSAPLFVRPSTGLNDDLSGVERPVQFDILDLDEEVQIVQSLAKWKRLALHRYSFPRDSGLYTDMNAIRRDERLDNLHSVYVDQWDWEMVVDESERNLDFLEDLVRKIVLALWETAQKLRERFPQLEPPIGREVFFVTSQQLEDRWPQLPPHERENRITREHGTVFIIGIGGRLRSGQPHDGRAPDYDDWSLNGDILVWNPVLGQAFEVSSMGIRVDAAALHSQLREAGCEERSRLAFHKMLLEGRLPLTAGGGIGQSRICMLMLEKAHIGEVQVSEWPDEMLGTCRRHGIFLL